MRASTRFPLILAIAAIFLITSACGLFDAATRQSTATPLAGDTTTQPPVQTLPATETVPAQVTQTAPAPTETTAAQPTQAASETAPAPVEPSAYTGFVVFKQDLQEFQVINFNGEIQQRIAAPGFQAWSRDRVDIVGNNIYYVSTIDKQLYQANTSGLQVLPFQPPSEPFGFKISADEKLIAWSVTDWNSQPMVSELWVAGLDGSSPTQVARITSAESSAFVYIPLEWTTDGRILFNRSPTGFGGYILYGGSNSLYSYNPASQELVTYVPAEEMHGLCLDSYRVDLNLVAFNCNSSGPGVSVRNLSNATETPLAPIPDYPIAGSVRFSPSGAWLAYAAAKGNPEAEAGQLLVMPADMSTGPAAISILDRGFYYVQSWIDENTLLVTRNEDMATSILLRINRDGSGAQDLAQGYFIGMAP